MGRGPGARGVGRGVPMLFFQDVLNASPLMGAIVNHGKNMLFRPLYLWPESHTTWEFSGYNYTQTPDSMCFH